MRAARERFASVRILQVRRILRLCKLRGAFARRARKVFEPHRFAHLTADSGKACDGFAPIRDRFTSTPITGVLLSRVRLAQGAIPQPARSARRQNPATRACWQTNPRGELSKSAPWATTE